MGYEDELSQLGFDGYLRKPVTQKDLLKELGRHLGYVLGSEFLSTSPNDNLAYENPEVTISLSHLDDHHLQLLRDEWLPNLKASYEKIDRKAFMMTQYETLSEMLREVGKQFQINKVKSFAKRFQQSINEFDTQRIEEQLEEFQGLIKELEQST